MWRPTDSGPISGRWAWELNYAMEEASHLIVDGKERWAGDQGLGTAFKVCPCRVQLLPTSFLSFIPPALKRASHVESIQPMNLWLTSYNQTTPQSLTIWPRVAIARMVCSEEERWRWTNRKQSRNLGLHREDGAKMESPKTLCVHSVKWAQEYWLYSGRVLLMLSPFVHCLKVGKGWERLAFIECYRYQSLLQAQLKWKLSYFFRTTLRGPTTLLSLDSEARFHR